LRSEVPARRWSTAHVAGIEAGFSAEPNQCVAVPDLLGFAENVDGDRFLLSRDQDATTTLAAGAQNRRARMFDRLRTMIDLGSFAGLCVIPHALAERPRQDSNLRPTA
jgi:hypothetical protein